MHISGTCVTPVFSITVSEVLIPIYDLARKTIWYTDGMLPFPKQLSQFYMSCDIFFLIFRSWSSCIPKKRSTIQSLWLHWQIAITNKRLHSTSSSTSTNICKRTFKLTVNEMFSSFKGLHERTLSLVIWSTSLKAPIQKKFRGHLGLYLTTH